MPEFQPSLQPKQETLVKLGIFPMDFLKGYLTAMEWLLPEEDDEAPEAKGFAPETLVKIAKECEKFEAENEKLLAEYYEAYTPRGGYSVYECGGHDFFLSRNGHGSGFFDRGDEPCFELLQEAARACGESEAYRGDDGLLHI